MASSLLLESIKDIICIDKKNCVKKSDINKKNNMMLKILIDEKIQSKQNKDPMTSNELILNKNQFYNINQKSEIDFEVHELYDFNTKTFNVKYSFFICLIFKSILFLIQWIIVEFFLKKIFLKSFIYN